MKPRQDILLKNIIQEYIKKAQPVGSKVLSQSMHPTISSATIRNEMADLIKKGYLIQPHLSAGRIPTLKGWEYYLENLLNQTEILINQSPGLIKQKSINEDKKETVKGLIRKMADLTQALAFIAFNENSFYYTGLTNLFNQPEFESLDLICNVSRVVDHLDEILEKIFNSFDQEIKILIGQKNPFGKDCGTILVRSASGLIGILGPLRMDYEKNLNQVKKVCQSINQI
jgi:heat-inducible transcriptional repressor